MGMARQIPPIPSSGTSIDPPHHLDPVKSLLRPARTLCGIGRNGWYPRGQIEPGIEKVLDFFLAGVLALWNDHDMLLMQRLSGPFELGSIHLLTDEAKQLLDEVVLA